VLTTGRVVFLVVAAAAPMAAMVGNMPLALTLGNGAGLPAAFLVGLAVLLCFSVGYAAMGRRVVNTGAFYTYIARSLGKPVGVAAAYVAVLSYTALACGLVGAFGYFAHLVLLTSGVDLPWYTYSAIALIVVAVLGYRSVNLSAKVLGTLMLAEFAVLLVFDGQSVLKQGAAALPSASWSVPQMLSGSVGIALMFAFVSFVGFESAALYGEETRNPERTIPRATYIAVSIIGVFYILTSWITIGAAGGTRAPDLARQQEGNLLFALIQQNSGTALYNLAAVLLCTSVLASLLALHNAASRYLFALGRERVLPQVLGNYHPNHLSPHVGSLTVTVVATVVTAIFALTGADPYTNFATSTIGLGTLGVIALQAAAALAVIVFFWRRSDRTWWHTVLAPGIGFLGLGTGFVLAVTHYAVLSGSNNAAVNDVPIALAVVALLGVLTALRLRARHPAVYAMIADSQLRRRTRDVAEAAPAYTRRYCLVGAGPSGLIMARALIAEGVPFDWFEKHTDVGGIWDMDNTGSPIYRSAHFISSKYTSGFYGYPMPEDYPDYPVWWQIRDYIRGFADAFDLRRHVTFGVAVEQAQPRPGDSWDVTLSTGETRHYDGIIAAPGVTWHPNLPDLPGAETFRGEIRHSVTFHDGLETRDRRVLVVGAGNSGVDIACDAARNADAAFLSLRRGYRFVPKHIFGIPTDALINGDIEPPRGVTLAGDNNQLVDSIVGDLTRYGLPAPDHDLLTSHPIMNTQVLHHLSHGDLRARPDVARLTPSGVEFVDGTSEEVDLILLATGYAYKIPFLDESLLQWKAGHPQLYLNVFSREHDSLYVLGFIEFADAAYKRFDEMAQLIVLDIRARETGRRKAELNELKKTDEPDLRGGIQYLDSPRHANYVNSHTYQGYLAEIRDRFDWPDVTEDSYSTERQHEAAAIVPTPTEVPS
jgi:amino acid transporter